MLDLDTAIVQLLNGVKPVSATETLALLDAHHRVLAQDQISSVNVPPADASAMDGYAIRFADRDLLASSGLPISQRVPAGHAPTALLPKTAARIFTGGVMPAGADTVVIQENCEVRADALFCNHEIVEGSHVRYAGQDVKPGARLLAAGSRLRAQDLGLLASAGINTVPVYKPLRVGVIATGSELVAPGENLAPGQIFDSNRYTLKGLLNGLQVTMVDYGRAADDLELTVSMLKQAANECDAIITTGGVSVGEEDYVKHAVERLGKLNLWKLAIKPGKPFAFGQVNGTPFLGLPGNPVAVFITFLLLVRPFLLRMQNVEDTDFETVQLPANFSHQKPNSRREFIRVRCENGRVQPFHSQDSGVLSSTQWANALAILYENHTFEQGELLDVIPLSQFSL